MAEHDHDYELIARCRQCNSELTMDTSPYGLHQTIEQYLKSKGFKIVTGKRAKEDKCGNFPRHEWEGRFVCGIPFRKCTRCGKLQRLLYSSKYEDVPMNESVSKLWDSEPRINPSNPKSGIEVSWE